MKKHIFIASLALAGACGNAQTLQEIVTKTENENFDAAAKDFRALIAKDPNKGEYYFYYGENFFRRGENYIDSAGIYYNKGVEVNATSPLNYVGLGKILLTKNDVAGAKTQFFKAATLGANKNAEVLRRTAEAWLATDNKNPDEAMNQANAAIKMEPKNPMNYILLGDAQLEKNPTDGSGPIKSYKTATTLNPKSTLGILREGKLYQRGRNYQLALDKYKEAEAIDANFAPAYREKAELYFLVGQPAKSIENWKKYLELNNSDYARYRFMSALFKNKQYSEAVAEYEILKKQNFSSLYMERLAGYSYAEMGDKTDKEAYTKGLKAMDAFFKNAGADFKYLGLDYKYRGLLMFRSGQDSLGIIEMEKAIAIEPALAGDIYSEVANTSYKNKKYDKAIFYFEKKIALDSKLMNNNDWFSFGRAFYYLAGAKQNEASAIKDVKQKAQKEAELIPLYIKADSAFAQLVRLNPNWSTAYVWRGRTNASLDPKAEKELTKEMYEKVLSVIKPEEKATTGKKDAIEAYEYLGYYFVTKKDKANADAMFNAIKELDPNNQKQKDYFNPPKAQAPKPGAKPAGR
jgi:tetratricopeptide (TPR) repeat protein